MNLLIKQVIFVQRSLNEQLPFSPNGNEEGMLKVVHLLQKLHQLTSTAGIDYPGA